jgi:hypothetical protein
MRFLTPGFPTENSCLLCEYLWIGRRPLKSMMMVLFLLLHAGDDLRQITQIFYVRDRELDRLNVVR